MPSNSDDRRTGAGGAIYLGGPVGTGTRVAAKVEWTLDLSRNYADGSAFGDTNQRWFASLRNTAGTYRGQLDLSGDKLFAAAALGPQSIYVYADDGTATYTQGVVLVAHGSGFIDATVTVPLNEMVSINGNFRASNNWIYDLPT